MSEVSLSEARAYIHAGDRSCAGFIDPYLFGRSESAAYLLGEEIKRYLADCMTPQIRGVLIDRKAASILERHKWGISQRFTPRQLLTHRPWEEMVRGCRLGPDVYVIPKELHTSKAAATWLHDVMTTRIRAMFPEKQARMFVNESHNYRYASDRRRRIDERLDAFAAAVSRSEGIDGQALRAELRHEYIKWMLGLILIKRGEG